MIELGANSTPQYLRWAVEVAAKTDRDRTGRSIRV